jgi:pimeloyl-ACP methyl ester carboxylesterase
MPTLTTANDRRVSYRQTRDDVPPGTRPVLLVHRAGGSSRDWLEVIGRVGALRRVVALDLPGHGRSDGRPLTTVADMAEHLAHCLRPLGLSEPVVCGHSMGGAVALETCLARPAVASALVMIASAATLRVSRAILDAVRDHFEALPQLMGAMAFSKSTPEDVVRSSLASLFDAPRDAVLADLQACDSWGAEGRIGDLRIPVTLLLGKDDLLVPSWLGGRFGERVAHARVQVVEGAGHMVPQEQPSLVAEVLMDASAGASPAG